MNPDPCAGCKAHPSRPERADALCWNCRQIIRKVLREDDKAPQIDPMVYSRLRKVGIARPPLGPEDTEILCDELRFVVKELFKSVAFPAEVVCSPRWMNEATYFVVQARRKIPTLAGETVRFPASVWDHLKLTLQDWLGWSWLERWRVRYVAYEATSFFPHLSVPEGGEFRYTAPVWSSVPQPEEAHHAEE